MDAYSPVNHLQIGLFIFHFSTFSTLIDDVIASGGDGQCLLEAYDYYNDEAESMFIYLILLFNLYILTYTIGIPFDLRC